MDWDYSPPWAELRRLRRRLPTTFSCGTAILVLLMIIRLFFLYAKYGYWSCPRCGKPFHMRVGRLARWQNVFARRCVNCGLPKWVDAEPDPKLKRQLRDDSILRLV